LNPRNLGVKQLPLCKNVGVDLKALDKHHHQGFFITYCAHNKYLLFLMNFNQEINMATVEDQKHGIN
jgi:hypothetical protein